VDTLVYAGRVVPELSDAPPYCVIYVYLYNIMCIPVLYYYIGSTAVGIHVIRTAAIYRTQSPDTRYYIGIIPSHRDSAASCLAAINRECNNFIKIRAH